MPKAPPESWRTPGGSAGTRPRGRSWEVWAKVSATTGDGRDGDELASVGDPTTPADATTTRTARTARTGHRERRRGVRAGWTLTMGPVQPAGRCRHVSGIG